MATFRDSVASIGRRGAVEGVAAVELFRSGLLGGVRPRETVAALKALVAYGQLGAGQRVAAIRHGPRPGLIDELGALTFDELNRRSDGLACVLADRGVTGEDCIGIMCRNHRGFLDITFAAAKLGARTLYLNTDFAGPQLRDVCAREGVTLLVHDAEYAQLVGSLRPRHGVLLGWHDGEAEQETVEQLVRAGAGRVPPPPVHASRVVLLTSGTTGSPKGAPRHSSSSIAPLGAILSKVPYRAGQSTFLAAPMFHALGYTQLLLAIYLGNTVVAQRRFTPERVLDAVVEHRPTALVAVPVMLQRLVAALEQHPGRWDTSSLRIVFLSGSQLGPELVRRAQATIGHKLYNFYGSTEVAYATFATPEDLRAAPGTAGRPPFGTLVRLYDARGNRVEGVGKTGRIFVGNTFQFEGYTGGGGKEVRDGLMSTGDVGHFDAAGRLFIDGRDDEMVISGGENVFPGEVEELLVTHPEIEEASVIGVDDADFGQRLAAFVVTRTGSQLADADVKEFVAAHLARFKVPRDIAFVTELPRNPAGKVLKRELRHLHSGQDAVQA